MPDVQQLQTLGVKVTLDGAQQAAQGLDNVAQAGARAESSTAKLTSTGKAFTDTERAILKQLQDVNDALVNNTRNVVVMADALDKANQKTRDAGAAQQAAGDAANLHGLQLGRLRNELGTLAGRLDGTNTALLRMVGAIGAMGVGDVAVIGALAGAAALGYAWKKMQGQAEEFAKAVQDSMQKAREESVKTVLDMGTYQLQAAQDAVKKAKEELSRAVATPIHASPAGAGLSVQYGTTTATDAAAKLAKAQADLDHWEQVVAALNEKMRNDADALAAAQLATLLKSDNATQQERDRALALYKQWTKEIADLGQSQTDNVRRLSLVSDQQTLGDALFPKQKLDTGDISLAIAAHKDLTEAVTKQLEEMRKANLEAGVEDATQQKLNATEGISGGIKEYLNAQWDAQIARIKAYGTESGIALTQTLTTIDATEHEAESRAKLAMKIEEQKNTTELLTRAQKEAEQIGNRNAKTAKDQTDAAAAQIKYAQDIQDIWTKGIEKIVTNGTKSFHDFFDDVLRMFEQLMKRMEKAGNDSGIGYQLLGLGSAAITGGVAGYQLGQSGGSGVGLLGGAASGALLGGQIAGPWGAVAGGLAGAVGGLLGAADAHKKAAAALQQAADSFTKQETAYTSAAYSNNNSAVAALSAIQNQYAALIDALNNLYGPSGPYGASPQDVAYRARRDALGQARDVQAQNLNTSFVAGLGQQYNATFGAAGAYANQVDAINQQYVQNSASARALGLGDGAQVEITAIRDRALQQLAEALEKANTQSQQNSLVRIATANGNTDLASWLSLQFQHQQALDDAIAQGLDDTSVALIKQANAAEDAAFQLSLVKAIQQKQLDAANALLGEYQKQTDAQSQAIQQTQQVVDTLQKFKDSIGLSGLSTLSPGQQVASARQQFQALVAQAMTGDATAASGLPGSAQTLLQASRSYNASGAGYVKDYKDVLAAVGAVQDQFGGTLSTEQLMLKELQRQTDQLNKQIALLQTGNQTAAAQYVQATLDAASRNGGLDTAIQQIHALFPGLQIGYSGGLVQSPGGAPGLMTPAGSIGANNNDFRDFDTYWSSTIKGYGGIQSFLDSGYPGAQSILARLHDDGIPGYWTGGAFGGGLMRVGEHGPEIIASGRASVMTPHQMNADVVAELKLLREEVRGLKNVTRLNGAKATSKR